MNRGINDSQDLPREYLGKIYDEIARQHFDKASREMEALAQSARELMESVSCSRVPRSCLHSN
ncbi:unnamed protein product [Dibothriocephalus latus]|uniref:SEC7 domain-containing protein n=1 Tax=Dibothriocephalus latus TaxID=60516 RepID=A0A3P6U447_DIBLA|nr:unnamed protein product [Dibothriocephalus latus]